MRNDNASVATSPKRDKTLLGAVSAAGDMIMRRSSLSAEDGSQACSTSSRDAVNAACQTDGEDMTAASQSEGFDESRECRFLVLISEQVSPPARLQGISLHSSWCGAECRIPVRKKARPSASLLDTVF